MGVAGVYQSLAPLLVRHLSGNWARLAGVRAASGPAYFITTEQRQQSAALQK